MLDLIVFNDIRHPTYADFGRYLAWNYVKNRTARIEESRTPGKKRRNITTGTKQP
jgi:hypothetical protein